MKQSIVTPERSAPRLPRIDWAVREVAGQRVDIAEVGLYAAVLFGFLVYLSRFVTIPVTGTDSGNLLAISRPILHGDFRLLIDTQGPPLTALVYAAALPNGDWFPLNALVVVPALLLALGLAYFALRVTGSFLLAAVPVLVLAASPAFWTQNVSLSPYAAFTALAYAGVYCMCAYALGNVRLPAGALGALLLAASLYTFGQALAFFAIPALAYLVLSPARTTLNRLVVGYAFLAVFTLPWGVWHLLVGGPGDFEYYPLNWLGLRYADYLNEFWGRSYYGSPIDYLATVVRIVGRLLLPPWAWPVVLFGVFATWRTYGWRYAVFGCLALGLLSAPVIIRQSPVFARYWYGCLPVLALFITAGAGYALQRLPEGSRVLIACVVALGLFVQVDAASNGAYSRNVTRWQGMNTDLAAFAAIIDDSRGVIGRDARLQAQAPDTPMFYNLTLSEEDLVTYLSWRSGAEVAGLFREHDIGWVLVYNDSDRWELAYNRWLESAAGQLPAHYVAIESSGLVERIYRGRDLTLYRLKPLDSFEEAGSGR